MTTRFATVCLLNYFDGLFICIFLKAFEQQCYLGNWGQCSPFAFLLNVFFGGKNHLAKLCITEGHGLSLFAFFSEFVNCTAHVLQSTL